MSDAARGRALAAAAGLFALFLFVALAVVAGWTGAADRALLEAFRRIADPRHRLAGPDWVLPAVIGVTTLGAGVVRVPLTVAAALLLRSRGRPRAALMLVAAIAGGAAVLEAIKHAIARARPDLAWRLVREGDFAFPSGHSAGSMILYPLLGWLAARGAGRGTLGVGLGVAVALAVGISRVLLGVHWASDVVAGWAFGGACGLLAATLADPPPRSRGSISER